MTEEEYKERIKELETPLSWRELNQYEINAILKIHRLWLYTNIGDIPGDAE